MRNVCHADLPLGIFLCCFKKKIKNHFGLIWKTTLRHKNVLVYVIKKNDKDVLFSKDFNCLVPFLKSNILHCQQQQNDVINYPWVLNCWLDKKQFTDVTFPLAACDRHVFHFITQTTDRLMGKKIFNWWFRDESIHYVQTEAGSVTKTSRESVQPSFLGKCLIRSCHLD